MSHRRHQQRGERRRSGVEPAHHPPELLADADVVIAGLFSAQRKDHADLMDDLAAEITALGGRVVRSFVQRRGISGKKGRAAGGKANMDRPYSSRTLMSEGKLREIAEACTETRAVAVVFVNDLTARQRTALTEILGCPVLSRGDLPRAVATRREDELAASVSDRTGHRVRRSPATRPAR